VCMSSVQRAYKDCEYILVQDNPYPCFDYRASADYHRLNLLSEYEDAIYIDNDVYVNRSFDIRGNKPFFAKLGRRPDIFYIYNNGRCDLFRECLNKCYTKMPETYREMVEFNKRVSRFFADKYEPIDAKTYYHLMAHKWSQKVWMNKINDYIRRISP